MHLRAIGNYTLRGHVMGWCHRLLEVIVDEIWVSEVTRPTHKSYKYGVAAEWSVDSRHTVEHRG